MYIAPSLEGSVFCGECVEFISFDSIPYYADCMPLVSGLGYSLVDLKTVRSGGSVRVSAVISRPYGSPDADIAIGIDDCSRVHRLLLPRLEALLGNSDIYMEVTSPGLERNIRNAAEFALFINRPVRLWLSSEAGWVSGIIRECDSETVRLEPLRQDGASPKGSKAISYGEIAKAKLLHL